MDRRGGAGGDGEDADVPVEEPALAVTWADPPGPMVADVAEMVPVGRSRPPRG